MFIQIDAVAYLKIEDPYKASYGADRPINYAQLLAQAIMRSEIGNHNCLFNFGIYQTINRQVVSGRNLRFAILTKQLHSVSAAIVDRALGNPSAALRNKGPEAASVHPQDHEPAGRLGETEASADPSERRNKVI